MSNRRRRRWRVPPAADYDAVTVGARRVGVPGPAGVGRPPAPDRFVAPTAGGRRFAVALPRRPEPPPASA
ncbi:hypothetical protein ACN267_04390 [Micromonospora sp. WMMD734]|uniref:hypothetical protein n=1 Tax=Micromonospora sp. WMMD734 TaxID=3404129 RepID=UPI003B956F0D